MSIVLYGNLCLGILSLSHRVQELVTRGPLMVRKQTFCIPRESAGHK
jgi:hypothetical protein